MATDHSVDPKFQYALKCLLGEEGGLANVPGDRGGLTYKGVTQLTYDAYRSKCNLPKRPVSQMDDDEMQDIYYTMFYAPAGCPGFQSQDLAMVVFDGAVQHNPARSVRFLQLALRISADGKPGVMTAHAANTSRAKDTIAGYINQREQFYEQIVENDPTQKKFYNGWMNRCEHLRRECGV